MDKTDLIAKAAQEPEDRLLLARVLDKYEQCQRKNIPAAAVFLTPRERAMAENLLRAAGIHSGYLFDGGYPEAERTRLIFLPDWADTHNELAFLRAAFHGSGSVLSHRDLLGSLMALGVTRERLGDILVSPHSADIVTVPSLTEHFLREWTGAGRVKLTVTEITREELAVPAAQVKTIRDTVPSLRLDAVTASAFGLSRGKAAELIAAGRVHLDHVPCQKPDKPVSAGCVITARGLGRARLAQTGGLTKKGRTGITIEKFI